MKHRTLGVLLFICLLLARVTASVAADQVIRVALPGPVAVYLPVWVAKDFGFFKKYDLEVETVYAGSSAMALASLVKGDIQIQSGTEVSITSYLGGYRDLALFAALDYRLPFIIYAQPSIKKASELRGKKIGVTRLGGSLDFAVRYWLKQSGLDPKKDVTILQVGRVPDLLGALVGGSVDAVGMPIPFNFIAKKQGFEELADLTKNGPRYAVSSFMAKKDFLVDNEARMEGWIKAIIEAIHFIKTHRDESIKELGNNIRVTDSEVIPLAYDKYVKLWPRVPEIKPDDIKLVIEHISLTRPEAREIDPAERIYSRLVENVVKSGFVEQVYK